ASELGEPPSQRRLLVGGLVLVDDALGDGLVELAGRGPQELLRLVLVARIGRLAALADPGAQLALDRTVAQGALLVGLDPLDLGLDVCHWVLPGRSVVSVRATDTGSGPGVGHPCVSRCRWCCRARTT